MLADADNNLINGYDPIWRKKPLQQLYARYFIDLLLFSCWYFSSSFIVCEQLVLMCLLFILLPVLFNWFYILHFKWNIQNRYHLRQLTCVSWCQWKRYSAVLPIVVTYFSFPQFTDSRSHITLADQLLLWESIKTDDFGLHKHKF